MQYTVKKPINNNILRVVDPTGCELIVTGRGLGFGVKPGYKIEAETVERSYRMTSPAVQQKLVELLEQIPYEHLLLTDELVAMIRSRVNYPLNESLLITLAGFIALHIVNAELNTTMSVVNDVTRFVDGCVQVVEYFYNCHFDRDALDFSRFTVHLRFFAQRVFQGKQEQENDTHDEVFRALIARNCSEHYKCACCIAEYVRNTWHKELSDEELVFLTIHLKRIRMGK